MPEPLDREQVVDAVIALRSAGALTLDRSRWRAFLAEHTVDGNLDTLGRGAYTLFAGLDVEELERYYTAHPDVRERHQERARRLLEGRIEAGRRGWTGLPPAEHDPEAQW